MSTRTAEKHGERGLHKLRGLAHVRMWLQEPLAAWSAPPCRTLADLQHQARQHLRDGKQITAKLYLQIGRHLDPAPNRRPGDERVPRCPTCAVERERSRREYWWLLIMLMPFPAMVSRPALRPVALNTADIAASIIRPRRRPDRRSGRPARAWWAGAAALLLLLFAAGALVAPRVRASIAAPVKPSEPTRAGGPPQPGGAAPDAGHAITRDGSRPPSAGPSGGAPAGDPSVGGPTEGPAQGPGPAADPAELAPDEPGPAGNIGPPPPGPCDHVPVAGGPYRPFVGSTGGLCWQASAGWRPLEMSGLRAEPQDIGAVDVYGGRAVFFTATDNYVWGTVVDGAGNVSGWHQFRARADGYASGFNISARQPVTAVAASPDQVELYAVGLDEVVWYRQVDTHDLDAGPGWRTLLDNHSFADGGRFWMEQTLAVVSGGQVTGYAKDNNTYRACYPSEPAHFRWIMIG